MLEVLLSVINYAKTQKGVMNSQLAIMVGINETTLVDVLQGRRGPSAKLIFDLIHVLGLELVCIKLLSLSHQKAGLLIPPVENHAENEHYTIKCDKFMEALNKPKSVDTV